MSSRYCNKVVAYIDFLGFKELVKRSESSQETTDSLHKFLNKVTSGEIHSRAYGSVNYEMCPPDELDSAEAAAADMRRMLQNKHPIAITHFSDSLAISAASDDFIASQMLFELISQLTIEAWNSLGLLLRGGLASGMLVHEENGPLFGPAMIEAYHLESKIAKFPRVVISEDALKIYRAQPTFDVFSSLIRTEDKMAYVSLSSSLHFTLTDSPLVLQGENALNRVMGIAEATPRILRENLAATECQRVKEKIEWVIEDMKI